MRDLLDRTKSPARGFILVNADHFHFCDGIQATHDMFKQMGKILIGSAGNDDRAPDMGAAIAAMKPSSELCPADHAYHFNRSLALAHLDAHLDGNEAAAAFLEQDLPAVMAGRGINITPL
jgi:hypothetical protein